jgi:Uma2 family endonuclease
MVAKRASKRTPAEPASPPEPKRRQFSVDEYERMIALGIVQEGERVELLRGEIYCMAAMGARHMACVSRADDLLRGGLPATAATRVQGPIRLPNGSEPEPDIAIVRRRADYYQSAHPVLADVYFVIEVADSSLRSDRDRKLPVYAEAGIPESWLVDLPGQQIFVYREPRDGEYRQITVFKRGATVSPLAFPDLKLAVDDVLGPAESA